MPFAAMPGKALYAKVVVGFFGQRAFARIAFEQALGEDDAGRNTVFVHFSDRYGAKALDVVLALTESAADFSGRQAVAQGVSGINGQGAIVQGAGDQCRSRFLRAAQAAGGQPE